MTTPNLAISERLDQQSELDTCVYFLMLAEKMLSHKIQKCEERQVLEN
jgi:hypothetical protein